MNEVAHNAEVIEHIYSHVYQNGRAMHYHEFPTLAPAVAGRWWGEAGRGIDKTQGFDLPLPGRGSEKIFGVFFGRVVIVDPVAEEFFGAKAGNLVLEAKLSWEVAEIPTFTRGAYNFAGGLYRLGPNDAAIIDQYAHDLHAWYDLWKGQSNSPLPPSPDQPSINATYVREVPRNSSSLDSDAQLKWLKNKLPHLKLATSPYRSYDFYTQIPEFARWLVQGLTPDVDSVE